MISFVKIVQASSKSLFVTRQIFPASQLFSTKTIEEKLGFPLKPKKPLTPYFRYLKEVRPQVVKDNPKFSTTDIVKVVAKQWETVDEGLKKKFEDLFKKEQMDYVGLRAKYESKLTEDQRFEIKNAKMEKVESKEKRAMKKKIRELEKPKRPASAFLRFLSEERERTPRGTLTYREWQNLSAENWNKLSEEKRNAYTEAAKIEIAKYKQELAKWELKMVRQGHVDLVRNEALIELPTTKQVRRPKTLA